MAYPNTTSQSLHTLKINKVPDADTFEKMQQDNLVNANELYLVEDENNLPSTGILVTLTTQGGNWVADSTHSEIEYILLSGQNVFVRVYNYILSYSHFTSPATYRFSTTMVDEFGSTVSEIWAEIDNTGTWTVDEEELTVPTDMEAFVLVNVTIDANDNLTADHTYTEINTAFNNGKIILVVCNNNVYQLEGYHGVSELNAHAAYGFHANYVNTNGSEVMEFLLIIDDTNTWTDEWRALSIPTKTSDLTNDSGFLTSFTETDPTVPSWAKASTKPSYTASEVGAAASSHTHGNITNSGDITASATIANGDRLVINDESASKVTNSSITFGTNASQYLSNKGTWQNVPTVPTNISAFTNDSGFLTSYTETDPTVPSWAKASSKPSYTASEVGALSSDTTYVSSVNGQSGAVTITDSDEKLKTIHSSGNGTFYPIFGNMSTTAETKYYNGNYRYSHNTNIDSLQLGQVSSNSTAKGRLTLCSGPYYTYLDPPLYSSINDNRTYTLPNNSGTIALTTDIHTYTAGNGIDITNDVISAKNVMYVTFTVTVDNNHDWVVNNVSKTFSEIYTYLSTGGIVVAVDNNHEYYYLKSYSANSIDFCSSTSGIDSSDQQLNTGNFLWIYNDNTASYTDCSTTYLSKIYVNGVEEVFPSFYAPTSSGTSGQVLKSNGSNSAPTWITLTTTDEKVKQTAKSDNVNYKLLFTTSASPTSGNSAEAAYDTNITINPSTNTITATNFAGNATSATKATKLGTSSANTSAGSASVPVYFDEGVPVPVSLDDLRTDMGITNPITFWGVTTTTLTNGSTTTSLAGLSGNPQNGYVVIDGNGAQFIWGTVNNVAQWNQLGTGVAYKIIQSAVSSPTANGSTTAFIDTISQNANGVISVTKKNLDTSGTWSGSAAKLTTARSLKTKLDSTTAVTFDGSAAQDAIPVTGTLPIGNGGTGATTAKTARENLGAAPTPFVAGTQTASTNVWTGALPSNVTEYYNGLTIDYFLPYAGTSSAATLNLGGLGAKPVYVGNAATTAVTTHFPANSVLHLTYIVNSALNSGNGCWKVTAYQNSTYNYESCYVSTGADTAAKVGTLTNYALQPGYLQVAIYNANTAASALTLNINSTGAKPIYINGAASSSSNYTLPKGMYMVHYDGTKYDFRTDGFIDTYANTIVGNSNSYGETLPASGTTGQIFFQTSDPYYELPSGGTAGQALIKNSNNDRDVTWGNVDALPTQSGNSGKFLTTNGTTASWANVTLSDYVLKTGDTMTGNLVVNNNSIESQIKAQNGAGTIYLYSQTSDTGSRGIYGYNASGTGSTMFSWTQEGTIHAGGQLYGAVWNDYAEYRQADSIEPGRCVVEKGDDTLTMSSKRMQPGAEIISDTFGFAIGQTEKAQTPIATSGRVLAYPYESLEEFKNAIGRPVCSGPNGTVSIMTDEEYQKFGYCAIGTISAVPEYETWGEKNIAVNNRVWIRVR